MTSLSADFVRNVEDLAEWLPLQNWTSVCEGSGETLEKCAYKGYNSKLRGFVNSFGTDYMNDATFGDLSDSKLDGDCWLNFDRWQDDFIQGLFDQYCRNREQESGCEEQ